MIQTLRSYIGVPQQVTWLYGYRKPEIWVIENFVIRMEDKLGGMHGQGRIWAWEMNLKYVSPTPTDTTAGGGGG